MFDTLLQRIDEELTKRIFRIGVAQRPTEIPLEQARENIDTTKRLGRNDPCWCGSGKKWKRCHYPQLG